MKKKKAPGVLRLQRQRAAHIMHSKYPVEQTSKAGRIAAESRFEKQLREQFPDLDDTEIARRAAHLRQAAYAELAAKGVAARQRRQTARDSVYVEVQPGLFLPAGQIPR